MNSSQFFNQKFMNLVAKATYEAVEREYEIMQNRKLRAYKRFQKIGQYLSISVDTCWNR